MATVTFRIADYKVSLARDLTIGSSSFDASIIITGEGHNVFLHFLNTDAISTPNIFNPATKFGRIFLRREWLPVAIDLLRNETPMFCQMSDTTPALCRISTSAEPVGEAEA